MITRFKEVQFRLYTFRLRRGCVRTSLWRITATHNVTCWSLETAFRGSILQRLGRDFETIFYDTKLNMVRSRCNGRTPAQIRSPGDLPHQVHTKLTCCSLETIRVSQWLGNLSFSTEHLAGCGSALSGVTGALFLSLIIFEALPFCQAEV
jgi:hypothetical protein